LLPVRLRLDAKVLEGMPDMPDSVLQPLPTNSCPLKANHPEKKFTLPFGGFWRLGRYIDRMP
jgi:hypothetical protein